MRLDGVVDVTLDLTSVVELLAATPPKGSQRAGGTSTQNEYPDAN